MTVITRRRLLAFGGLAIVVGAGAGATTATTVRRTVRSIAPTAAGSPTAPRPPAQLVAVLAHEQGLIATLTAAISADPQSNPLLPNIRDDHLAHVQAIRAALGAMGEIAAADSPPSSPASTSSISSTSSSVPTSTPAPDLVAMREAEVRAQQLAATASAGLTGADAVLLASVSACEAGHVELLT
jgi:hypothetical protein